jgi:hypothetical protein
MHADPTPNLSDKSLSESQLFPRVAVVVSHRFSVLYSSVLIRWWFVGVTPQFRRAELPRSPPTSPRRSPHSAFTTPKMLFWPSQRLSQG